MENEKKEFLPRPVRRKLWSVLLMIGIFIGGLVAGGGLTTAAIVHRIRAVAHQPEKTAGRITDRMDRALDLTDEQKAAVETIVRGTVDDLLAQRVAMRRRTMLRLAAAREEMAAALTPEQQQKLGERFENLRKLWGVSPGRNEQ